MEEQNLNPVEETSTAEQNVSPVEETTEATAAVQPAPQKPSFLQKVDKFFGVTARNSNFRAEIVGGLTTFFAMCYILFVNPNQITGGGEEVVGTVVWNSVYVATALSALIGTLFYAVWVKMPFAQAPGMGLNSFFFVSFMLFGFGTATTQVESYQAGLSVILLSGILFMIISITGIRKKIAEAMPASLKKAIPAGIGLFIALIGFKNAGFVQANQYTFVQLFNMAIGKFNGTLNAETGVFSQQVVTWYGITAPLVMFFGLMMIAFLSKTKAKKFSVIIGIIFGAALYYLFNIGNPKAYEAFNSILNPADTFVDFGTAGIGGAFLGFKYWTADVALNGIMLVITFCLVDMFDTLGTLQGTAAEAGMLDENGNPQKLDQCLMADSAATLVGGVLGVSTVTTFVESATGVSAGARTGLSSLVVAFLFLIALFLSPLAAIIPSAAVAPALVYVGVLMLKNIKEVDFNDMVSAVPAFLTVIMMPLSYSISNGIAVGLISYSILKLATVFISGKEGIVSYFKAGKGNWGDFFSKDIIVLIIAILFTLRFFLVSM